MNERHAYRGHFIDLALIEIEPTRFRWLLRIDSAPVGKSNDVLQTKQLSRRDALLLAHREIDALEHAGAGLRDTGTIESARSILLSVPATLPAAQPAGCPGGISVPIDWSCPVVVGDWIARFGVTETRLREALARVGPMPAAVEYHLKARDRRNARNGETTRARYQARLLGGSER